MKTENLWTPLPYNEWKDTLDTLHMKMQIVGKVKLALTPFINQWWNTAFHLNAWGMTSGLIPYNDIIFEANFDFNNHKFFIRTSKNIIKEVHLMQCSVAEFYKDFMDTLNSLGIHVSINTVPSEVQNPVPCDIDKRSSYDKDYVHNWWKILLRSNMIFERFRHRFRGKSSPVHFFWGGFDLAHTRFSGKISNPPEKGGIIMRYAENEENFSIGFWPGNVLFPKPIFYSYVYPAPKGIESVKINPDSATFNASLGEFILEYDDVCKSESPDEMIMEFLNSTYEESAKLAGWDIKSFEGPIPQ